MIEIFNEDIELQLPDLSVVTPWVNRIIRTHNPEINLTQLNFIFCSDAYLHQMNMSYLNHDTFTDIITFDNSDSTTEIEGDIFISADRIAENAKSFQVPFEEEMYRVMAHGLLHLLGENDKTSEEKAQMKKKEEACLSLLAEFK